MTRANGRLDDVARLEALHRTGLMDSPAEESYDRFTRLAVKFLRAPVALVSLVDDHRQFFKSLMGLGEPWATLRETPLSHSFCQHVVKTQAPLLVSDARTDARVLDNRAIDELGVVSYAGVPLFSPGAQPLGALCVVDVSPRQWTEDEVAVLQDLARSVMTEIALRESIRQLEGEAVDRERFVGILAHDLRQPLATVRMAGELLGKMPLTPERQAKHIERLRTAGDFMSRMVTDLLDVARSRGSAMPIARRPTDFVGLVRDTVEELRSTAPARELMLELPDGLPATLDCDPDRLKQVVLNLVGNALQYGRAEAPVRIRARMTASEAELRVSNDNQADPISPTQLSRLFQPFVRGAQAQGPKTSNLGLGLFIVEQVAAAHGGKVMVESSRESGTSFTVRLPRLSQT